MQIVNKHSKDNGWEYYIYTYVYTAFFNNDVVAI